MAPKSETDFSKTCISANSAGTKVFWSPLRSGLLMLMGCARAVRVGAVLRLRSEINEL